MSSTDLAGPSRKLLFAAIIIVVALHVLTVIALAAIKTPELKVENKNEASPIEIELVSLPAETATPVAEVKTVAPKEEPRPPVVEQPQPKSKPVVQPKPKTPAKPVVTETKVQPKVTPKEPVKKQETKEKPKEPLIDPKMAEAAANEQRKLIAAQAERAAQQAQAAREAQANRDAQAQAAREAQAQAARDAQAARAAAEAKAVKEAAARAQAEAAAKAAAAASNTPVNFTATNADWASAPNFSFPDRAARRASSGDVLEVVLVLRVNKQGGIDSVNLAKSSGNTLLDKEAQRQVRSGKFKPFTNKSGAPVVGNVTLPIAYKVP
ncbi:TonB family protein [Psychrobacter alimentarius]|uniref:TonB family protein n=1 Tax=Psychrobacter alimentarius TaxID=261164 RepID=UPI0019198B56|nr:TonB family protein [Psychrobacter alimentarius]